MNSGGFTIKHQDEFERNGQWRLARRSLGLQAFGMNAVELQPGESIKEHDETEFDEEEVYVVWRGDLTMIIDGQEHPAPEGTFVRLDPQLKRYARNDSSQPATLLIVSAPRESGFKALDWA